MARRPIGGVLAQEGIQTGDGRLWTPGAFTWADLPIPLAVLQQSQHAMSDESAQIGVITGIMREGNDLRWTGFIDTEIPEGAEVVRRLGAGSAPMGGRWGISVDGDDYRVELVDPNSGESEGEMMIASGHVRGGHALTRLAGGNRAVVAGAGEPDPGGQIVAAAASDEMIERSDRTRIRGATLCAIPAFVDCYGSLLGEGVTAAANANDPPWSDPTKGYLFADDAPILAAGFPVAPPVAWFEDPEFTEPTKLHVTDDGQILGHIAQFGTCHIGIDGCQEPPTSNRAYDIFLTGELRCAEGCRIPVGTIAAKGGHMNDTRADVAETLAHYDDTETAAAFVAIGEDEFGIWVAGMVRPDITDEQLVVLSASKPSGDWRPIDGKHELVAVCMVNTPGFPVGLAASAAPGNWLDGAPEPVLDYVARAYLDSIDVDRPADLLKIPN